MNLRPKPRYFVASILAISLAMATFVQIVAPTVPHSEAASPSTTLVSYLIMGLSIFLGCLAAIRWPIPFTEDKTVLIRDLGVIFGLGLLTIFVYLSVVAAESGGISGAGSADQRYAAVSDSIGYWTMFTVLSGGVSLGSYIAFACIERAIRLRNKP